MAKKPRTTRTRATLTGTLRRIGLTKLRFQMGSNTFTIYGQNIGVGATNTKAVYLTANNHLWTGVSWSNVSTDSLQITGTCAKKKHKPHKAKFTTDDGDGDEDLTVTITFDDVNPTDVVDCTFTDVEYDP